MEPPLTYFCLTLDLPLGGYGPNNLMHVRGHKHFMPTKFHKHLLSGYVLKADCVPIHNISTCISACPPPPFFT